MLLAQEINAVYLENAASKTLMDAYERLGNYKKAICFARIFISTKDSLFREEKTKSLAEAESKFKSEKKQLEIDKLNKEKELQQSELSRQQEMKKPVYCIHHFRCSCYCGLCCFCYEPTTDYTKTEAHHRKSESVG
jgi:hypothetical protein